MEFPRFVYLSPGTQRHSSGGTYRFVSVSDQAEHDAYLAKGWAVTVRDAIAQAGEAAFLSGLNDRQAKKIRKLKPWLKLQAQEAAQKAAGSLAGASEIPEVHEDDNAPPTRAELQAKATELGIKFDGRTSDKTLLAKIDAAMKGPV